MCISSQNEDGRNQNKGHMTKIEQLMTIDNYIDDKMSKDELRQLVCDLINDESLVRSFRLLRAV